MLMGYRTVRDELGRQLPHQLRDLVPLPFGPATLDLRLQPGAGLPRRHDSPDRSEAGEPEDAEEKWCSAGEERGEQRHRGQPRRL